MKPLTKAQAEQLAEYRRASDELRKKIAATAVRDENEILPVNGVFHFPRCRPLTSEQAFALFGKSEFSDSVLREIADDGVKQTDELVAYKRAAATLRKEIAATAIPDDREILPVGGRVHLTLTGKPLNPEQQKVLFGESAFSITVLREFADDGT
ncbi:hypothetical protein F2P44_14390 [Massilia sp. CCM 8695]|uniref:DNA-binding protein n=1 Tax=Massilia frigida TaxID=2609281 RepID=A0ABX0NET2_9BURK|nr:hypothetical protein [Massilia frigida]NHZ80453.1 hypothetical protein [Massilia frigida]